MARDRDSHRVVLDIDAGRNPDGGPPRADEPFCIALLGDFSARGDRAAPAGGRRPVLLDRDDFDAVLARVAPALELELPDASRLTLRFAELDDFHPDRLYEQVTSRGAPMAGPAAPSAGSLLDQILDVGIAPSSTPGRAAPATDVSSLVRALLHHPRFRALESLWRAAFFVARRVETSTRLRIYLVDVAKAELAAALPDGADPRASAVRELLARGPGDAAGGDRWSLIVGCYTFGGDPGDVPLLDRLAQVAESTGAPWLSAAHPAVVGAASFADGADPDDWSADPDPSWTALRQSDRARWLALGLPRFLLRAPYGRDGEECERFDFEELAGDQPAHEQLLWGNPAVLLALPFADAFAEAEENGRAGQAIRPDAHLEISGLPLHVVETASGRQALAAEALLSDRAVERILERGPIPVMQRRDSDTVRLARLQSLAASGAALAGRWRSS